jgi:hypothetical protein
VTLGADTGFSAWPLIDPTIIGDVNNAGGLTNADSTILSREILGFDRPEIPPLPATPPTVFFSGPDPLVSLPRNLSVRAGEIISVPVNLDTAAGLEAVQLRLAYDADALELVHVGRGTLTGDFQWFVQRSAPGTLVIDTTRLTSLADGTGSLLDLQFRARPSAQPGEVLLDLQWVELNEGRLTLNPAPQVGADPTDGLLRILPRVAAPQPSRPALAAPESAGGPHVQVATPVPTIDFSQRYAASPFAAPREERETGGWKTEFVTQLARNDDEHNPNSRISVTLPKVSKTVVKAAAGTKPGH